jgi:hypothetical protein
MTRLFFAALAALSMAPQDIRFVALDIVLETGDRSLAAYQFELLPGSSKIVGVEGGEHSLFADAPYYDPAALQGGRIVVAAFTTEEGAPAGRTRVARLHLQETENVEYKARLIAAASPGGDRIHPVIQVVRVGGKK